MIRIDNLDIPELEVYRQRSETALLRINEPGLGIFICESTRVIRRALDAGYEPLSVLTSIDDPDEETASVYADCSDVPVYMGNDEILKELSGYPLTGGILCAMKRRRLPSVEEILEGKGLAAVLENVQNPTNIGAIFRSAAAMRVEAVILTADCCDPLYRRAERVSMGTVFQVPWTKADKKTDVISVLSDSGFSTVAMALTEGAKNIRDQSIKNEKKLAVILGSEGYGLKPDTIRRCDHVAMIPMAPAVDSLNVAAASAVMFWELSRDLW